MANQLQLRRAQRRMPSVIATLPGCFVSKVASELVSGLSSFRPSPLNAGSVSACSTRSDQLYLGKIATVARRITRQNSELRDSGVRSDIKARQW